MKKTIIFLILLIAGTAAGYLYYDWHVKTHVDREDRYTYIYSWTDKQGQTHFSDQKPPRYAQNLETIRALEQPEEPLTTQITEEIFNFVYETRNSFASMIGSEDPEPESLARSTEDPAATQAATAGTIKRRWPVKKRGKT